MQPNERISELKAEISLAEIIGEEIALRDIGGKHIGLCPFHAEKTPSFYVYEQRYQCFGCGASGDAISWVMHTRQLTFPEALEFLGMELFVRPREDAPGTLYSDDTEERVNRCREKLPYRLLIMALSYERIGPELAQVAHITVNAPAKGNELKLITQLYGLGRGLLGQYEALKIWEELAKKYGCATLVNKT